MFLYDWIIKPFSEENKGPRTLFKARKVAGSTYKHIKKVEQYEIVMSFFLSSLLSHENEEFLYLVCIKVHL